MYLRGYLVLIEVLRVSLSTRARWYFIIKIQQELFNFQNKYWKMVEGFGVCGGGLDSGTI